MKKLLSIVLALALVMAMSVTGMVSSAADEGKIQLVVDESEASTDYTLSGKAATGTWDTADKKEGTASLSIATGNNANAFEFKNLDLELAKGNVGYFWIYIENVTNLNELYWELSSGGGCTTNCVRYIIKVGSVGMTLQNGWNKVAFAIHDDTTVSNPNVSGFNYANDSVSKGFNSNYAFYKNGSMYGTTVDWANINYFRLIANAKNGGCGTVKLNALTLDTTVTDGNVGNGGSEEDTSTQLFVDKDTEAGRVSVAGGTWASDDVKESGTDALTFTRGDSVFTVMYKNADLSPFAAAEEGMDCYFWIYVETAQTVPTYYWEISSAGTHTGACVRYIVTAAHGKKLQAGWNKVEFKLHDSTNLSKSIDDSAKAFSSNYAYYLGGGMEGNVDWSKINYIRFVLDPGAAETVKINAFTFGTKSSSGSGNGGNSVDAGDATPIVTIVFATLASALLAGVVYISLKKRTER